MIRYRLVCDARHDFEGWFRSSDDCDRQIDENILSCPVCGSSEIGRALMAPAIAKSQSPDVPAPVAQPQPPVPDGQGQALLAANPKLAEMATALRELRDKIVANADDVGTRFPEEARRIHYGEAETRGIYGHATPDEAASLIDEGIEIMPLPVLPDDHN